MNPWPQLFRHKSSPEFADQFGIPHDSKIFCNSPSPPPVRRSRPSRRRPSRPERGDRGHRRRRSRRLGIPAAPPESQCPQAPKTCQRSDERVWGRASKQEKGRRSCTQRRPRWAVKRNKRKRNINYTKNHTGSPSDLILIFLLLSNFSSHPKAAWQLSTPPAPARNEDSAASQSGDFHMVRPLIPAFLFSIGDSLRLSYSSAAWHGKPREEQDLPGPTPLTQA